MSERIKDWTAYTKHEFALIGKQVVKNDFKDIDPDKVENYTSFLENPEPTLIYKGQIFQIRDKFCEYMGIQLPILCKTTQFKRLFCAVIVQLYYPAFITGYREEIMSGLAHELSGALSCKRPWISQQHDYIQDVLNHNKRMYKTYEADRVLIHDLSERLGQEFKINNIEEIKTELF